ncbi:hypothetical protein C8F04DRAFT_1387935 [Mycena alexandri]|uniref:Mucoidy inhibitor A n=1 Tax=Mycena alexandri TaxID=1745969 RepID=A0AAD6XIL7_9AGAR|nr:hypothetical protein C8F04DRAFT_1387935 [Mycena alexandri]
MTTTSDHPPAFEPVGSIELRSLVDSKIIGVSLYSNRAEITRVYKFAVKTGQNQVNISGLPNILEAESLRVEGRGAATIHDVTVSTAKGEHVPTSSPALAALLGKREKTVNALARCHKSIASLEHYLSSLTVEHLDVSKLESVMEQYDSSGDRLDAKKSELTEELRIIDLDITAERTRIAVPHENDKLRVKAAIGVFAQAAGDVEIALIYAVPRATWTAFYDIRVDMSTKEDPITLIYKAGITQNTGESWDDVPLTLETSTPTFGLGIPELSPWNLDVQRFAELKKSKGSRRGFPNSGDLLPAGLMSSSRDRDRSSRRMELEEMSMPDGVLDEPMGFGGASVTSKGNFSATFRVPGMVSIPTDGEAHNFTIVQLNLKADMSWVCVPKVDTKAHITARITNASEYTLLAGTASVYVDGSFISRSDIPSVSPKESFDCPLGVDPSIRITYHPVIKNLSQSGFYTKSANYVFSQRITVFNTKGSAIERLKIIDQIPTSQNSQIEVKLVSPALTVPTKDTTGMSSINLKAAGPKATPQIVTVARGVVAQWDGVDEPDYAVEALGLDRKLNWVCSVGAQAKINLTLDWEVSVSPASVRIQGL